VTEAPAVGERFEYIFQQFGKKDNMSDAIVDTALVMEQGFDRFNLAKDHYFKLYVYNPMNIIMELVYGQELASQVLNPKNYEQVETVSAKGGNILGFFGVDKHTSKRKYTDLGVNEKLMEEIRQLRLTGTEIVEEIWVDDVAADVE
jgi:hypothetical protein